MNFSFLAVALQVAEELINIVTELAANVPVVVPPFKTYLGKQHVQIQVTVTPLAS